MKLWVRSIILLVLAPLAWAAGINAAWKVPLDYVSPQQMGGGKIPKLQKPPGESAFFQPGDELWDLSRGFMGVRLPENGKVEDRADLRGFRKWPGEWLVWNARSGMLVARGSETDIVMAGELMNFANLPVTLRAKFELSVGSAGKLRSVTLGAQSGKRATAEGEGLEVEAELLDPGHTGPGGAKLRANWEVNGEPWSLETAYSVHYGERTRVAAHGMGEERWELFATVTREFFHGVPIPASRWRETAKGIEPWMLEEEGSQLESDAEIAADDALELRAYRVPENWLKLLGVGREEGEPVDPFGPEEDPPLPKIGAPALPGGWEGWLQDEFLDVREVMRQKGLSFREVSSFATFNPQHRSVLVFASSMDQDLFGQVAYGIGCYIPSDVWVSSNQESGAWGLAVRSGESSKLAGKRGDKKMKLEIEPLLDSSSFVQLRYEFDNRAEAGGGVSVDAASKFLMGTPQVIGSSQAAGREERKVALSVSYLYE